MCDSKPAFVYIFSKFSFISTVMPEIQNRDRIYTFMVLYCFIATLITSTKKRMFYSLSQSFETHSNESDVIDTIIAERVSSGTMTFAIGQQSRDRIVIEYAVTRV